MKFTQSEYEASIPENSMGRVYVTPSDALMGIRLSNETLARQLSVKFKIRAGDPDDFFKAESETVGDFVFLMIRIRTNNLRDVLNRERNSNYALEIVCRVRENPLPSSLKSAAGFQFG